MDAQILCSILAKRIPPEQFSIRGEEVVFFDPEQNNKPVGSPNESPYDTLANRAIVADVIANYEILAAAMDSEMVKQNALVQLAISQKAIQEAGMTCTNGIKLQVGEDDLLRWTQLMMNIMAFSPPIVQIRDYDNIIHTLNTATEVIPMMAEVAAWGQAFLAETWRLKDEIINS